jgi:general secretion pathway protein D
MLPGLRNTIRLFMRPAAEPSRTTRSRATVVGALSVASHLAASTISTSALAFAAAQPPVPSTGASPQLSGDEAGLAMNTCKKWPNNRKFTITLPREAELDQLVNWMMSISCQKFIWNSKVRSGKVTIAAPEAVTLDEAYVAFYAALEQIGLTVEPSGEYFKIVETADAKALNLPLYPSNTDGPNNDRFITQLIRVTQANPKDVFTVLEQLKSKQGSVQAVGNLIVLTDRGSVVERLRTIIGELDYYGSGEKVFFYQLDHADADGVAKLISEVFGEGEGKSGGKKSAPKAGTNESPGVMSVGASKVLVDERSGTLIIIASEADYATIVKLVKRLDVPLSNGGGRIRVKRLKYADPKQLATVLQQAVAGVVEADKKGKSEGSVYTGEIKISPEEGTRSLLISANAQVYKELEKIIDELDVERRQLYLELYLLETTMKRDLSAGASGHGGYLFDGLSDKLSSAGGTPLGLVRTKTAPDLDSMTPGGLAGLTGLTAGLLGGMLPETANFFGQEIPAFGVVLTAIEKFGDANIVTQPHLPAADNSEVEWEFGRRVPTIGQVSFAGGAGGGSSFFPTRSINREDVTLRIKITPHVNSNETVTLDIDIEDKDLLETDKELGVTTSKRAIKTKTLLARHGQAVVLGGHAKDTDRITTSQVPGLGSIPLIGWLFKSKQKLKEKTHLLYVLVPHILNSPDDMRRIYEQRRRERQEFLERYTSFEYRKMDSTVNYRRKPGLLSSIDHFARELEAEERLLRQAEKEMARQNVTGELGDSFRPQGESEVQESGAIDAPNSPTSSTQTPANFSPRAPMQTQTTTPPPPPRLEFN